MKKIINAGCMAILLLVSACSDSSQYKKEDQIDALQRTAYENKAVTNTVADENSKTLANIKELDNVIKDGVKSTGDSANFNLQNGGAGAFIDWDKKIIKTAHVKMEVKNFAEFDHYVHTSLRNFGAYVGAEQQARTNGNFENSVTIKVPVDQFDNLLTQLPTKDNTIIEKTISSEDVSSEVVDTKARIEVKTKVRERYMHLLEGAKNMDDVLKVEGVVNDMQEAIESADGRVKHLVHEAAYSTIVLAYSQPNGEVIATTGEPGFGARAWGSLKSGGSWMADLLVGLLKIWPLILGTVVIVFWVRRKGWLKTTVATSAPQNNTTNV